MIDGGWCLWIDEIFKMDGQDKGNSGPAKNFRVIFVFTFHLWFGTLIGRHHSVWSLAFIRFYLDYESLFLQD